MFFACFQALFFKDLFYLFLERGEGREKEGEKHRCVRETSTVASRTPPTRDPAHNPGMCPVLGIEPATFRFVG